MWLFIVASLLLILFSYLYLTWNYSYWKNWGVPSLKPQLFFGNVGDSFLDKTSISEDYANLYSAFDGKAYGGFYRLRQPALIIRDLELVKGVLINDFQNFGDNDFQISEKSDPMMGKNPFVFGGDKWKLVRSQLSPGFTAGKMRSMFEMIREVCNSMINYLDNDPAVTHEDGIEIKDLTSKFTTDIVATCAYGLQGNSFSDPKAEFRQMGKDILSSSFWTKLQHLGIIFCPFIANLLGFRFIPKNVANWFQNVINETVKYRETQNITRNDFLQMLIQLKTKSTTYNFTNEHIAAHAATFFTDGFETSSTVITLALYELALNLNIQKKLQEEVDETLARHNGIITFDALQEMTYLDCVLSESMRKYPPLGFMGKVCTSSFKFPPAEGHGSDLLLKPGLSVVVSILGIHHDPNIYPDPLNFDPDRFTEEEKSKRHKCAYLPFSTGPRVCLGIKLAQFQMKAGLATIVSKMDVRPCKRTVEPKFIPGILFSVPDAVWLRFYRRM